jgi:hypothetical protein
MDVCRRRTPRVSIKIPVRWIHLPHPTCAFAANINAHGLFLVTPKQAAVGELMDLEAELPDGKLRMFAVSRYVGVTLAGHGIGAEIFAITPSDSWRWMNFYRHELGRAGVTLWLPRSTVIGLTPASEIGDDDVKIVALDDEPADEPPLTETA